MKTLSQTLKDNQAYNAEIACKALIRAFENGEKNGGSVEWEDLEGAYNLAKKAFPSRKRRK